MTALEMRDADRSFHASWKASSGHPGGWRVTRHFYPPLEPEPGLPRFQEALGPKGKLRLFRSHAAAARTAATLNGATP